MYYIALHCTAIQLFQCNVGRELYYISLHCTTMHRNALHCTAIQPSQCNVHIYTCTTSHHDALHCKAIQLSQCNVQRCLYYSALQLSMHTSCSTCEWVMLHMWVSHALHVSESCLMPQWVIGPQNQESLRWHGCFHTPSQYTHTHIHTYTLIPTHTHIHTYIRTYIHTYIHNHRNMRTPKYVNL